MIVLNKAYLTGQELVYVGLALQGQTSGNGPFTKKCHDFFREKYGFKKVLLTTSCTDALEMAALLLRIAPGDEVIIPSFTFVSTANAFILRGAKIVFADSRTDHPNIDTETLERLITPKTKAIVVVHYAGIAVDMDDVMTLAKKHNLFVVEDAAQAIDASYKQKPLGGIGHLGCISFHDTKNIVSGEGGLLIINDEQFIDRAEILWEKGTNRSAFIKGEVDKYGWVDVGSSFLPSELTAAFLLAQLESLIDIQSRRMQVWEYYQTTLSPIASQYGFTLPLVPAFAKHNAHIFYLVCDSGKRRDLLIQRMRQAEIQAFFHYLPLHLSKYHLQCHQVKNLPNAVKFSEQLIRLPLYIDLKKDEQDHVIDTLEKFLKES